MKSSLETQLLPYLLDCGFHCTSKNHEHHLYSLDPAIGNGVYRISLCEGKYLITLKDFSYNHPVEMTFGGSDYLHADFALSKHPCLQGYIGNGKDYAFSLSPDEQVKSIGICIMPEFYQDIVNFIPDISHDNIYDAFGMLNSLHPFPEGAAIMRQLYYLPVARTNLLYFEAKVKEFIVVLLDWYSQLQTFTNHGKVNPDDQCAVELVVRDIKNHFTRPLEMERCLDIACMSKSKLSVIFRQVTGLSMSAYLTNVRIEKAKLLLLSSGIAIQEISAQVGYQNHSSFAASFKLFTGYSPKEYRAAYQKKFMNRGQL